MATPAINPLTGERIPQPMIDQTTGERVLPSSDGIDPNRLSESMMYSGMLKVTPAYAYDQHDKIKEQVEAHGGGLLSDVIQDIKVGAEGSIFGLTHRMKLPETLHDPGVFDQFVSGLTTMLADLPVYLLGAGAGAAAGSEIPVVGNVAGGVMGAFALPAAMRKTLMLGIEKGDITSFRDLIERTAHVGLAGLEGAATGLVMGKAGEATLPFSKPAVAAVMKRAQQVAAITVLPDLFEGKVPTAAEFGVNAALLGALHLGTKGLQLGTDQARRGLMDVYAKTGEHPADVARKLQAQPPVQTDLEPGLRPAIEITRQDSTTGVIEADEGETHSELAERMGQKPVTMEELNRDTALADKVLEQPEIHLQGVIDRAWEIKKEAGDIESRDKPQLKSGRGFVTSSGDYLEREQAKSWAKKNEPDIYEMWAQVAGDEKAEFHSGDYTQARERVAIRRLLEGDPNLKDVRITALRESLNRVKAGEKDATFGEKLRAWFVGERDSRVAAVNQLRDSLRKLVPDFREQEALSLMRDFKGRPEELAARRAEYEAGDNKELKKLIPVIDRALNPTPAMLDADRQMTAFFATALDEGRNLNFLDSSINPERYVTHILKQAATDEGGKEKPLGRGKIGTRTPYAAKRTYDTILDALETGKVKARSLNAFDALTIYGDRHATAAATKLLLTELKNSEVGKWGSQKSENIPSDWKELAPQRQLFHHNIAVVDPKTGEPHVLAQSLFVPKEIAKAMAPIIEPAALANIPGFRAGRFYQTYIKAAELGLSVFHMKALNVTAMNNESLGRVIRSYQADMGSEQFRSAEREWIRDGLQTSVLGRTIEAYRAMRPSSIPSRMDVIRGTFGIKQMDKLAEGLTYETFDVVQRKFKVMDASLKGASWLADHPKATAEEYSAARRGIAKEVNAAYGGLNWEVLGWGKNSVELARAILLAPDWTFSNVFNLKYAFEGGAAGSAARRFWIKSAATGLVLTQAMTVLVSGQLSKHPTEVYLGKDKQGKERYSDMFFAGAPKDFVTLLNNVHDYGAIEGTAHSVVAKLGPLARTSGGLLSNRDWMGREIVKKGEGPVMGTAKAAEYAVTQLAPIPFSVSGVAKMLMDTTGKYNYWDYISVLGGSPPRHESPRGGKAQPKRRFSIRK